MDMLPPTSPPAIVASSNQQALDTLQRLIDAQHWLSEQEDQLPEVPAAPTSAGREVFLAELDAFWQHPVAPSPGAAPLPRIEVFASRLARAMRDDAALRHLDGSLSEQAAERVSAFTAGGEIPANEHPAELMFGNVAYAGTLVLADGRPDEPALLFSPDRGWEEFPRLDALYGDVERRVRERMAQGAPLPGMAIDDLEDAVDTAFVGTRSIDGDPFRTLAGRVQEVQRDQATVAWIDVDVAPTPDAAARNLAEVLPRAIALHHHLDLPAIMAQRNARLDETIIDEQLARLPQDAQEAWRDARAGYDAELQTAQDTLSGFGVGDVTSLDDFASRLLKPLLVARGIEDDPRTIGVDIYPPPPTPPLGNSLNLPDNRNRWFDTPPAGTLLEKTTLIALALRNVQRLEGRNLRAVSADGQTLARRLHPRELPALLRELDVAGKYREQLLRDLDTSPDGQLRRVIATTLQHARMRLELEDTRLGDAQPGVTRAFIDDRNERGYRWVRAAIDATTAQGRAKVEGHDIVVRQVTYKDAPMKDVLVIASRSPQSVPNVVLYTPDAPDRRAFREFSDMGEAESRFFHDPAFVDYLLDRLPADFAEVGPNGGRRFRISYAEGLSSWALSGSNRTGTPTAERFASRAVDGDFLEAAYDTAVSLASRNLSSVARSTREADADEVPSLDVEAIARSVTGYIGRPFQAAWRAYDQAKSGDLPRAFVDAADAYVASLDYLGAGALAPRLARPLLVRAATPSRPLVQTLKRMPEPDLLNEPRFVAAHVKAKDAQSFKDGIYTIGGSRYIEQGGRMYGVRFDSGAGRWRLARADASTTSYGPPIVRGPTGAWQHDMSFGGLGGMDPLAPNNGAHANARLSNWQRLVATRELTRRLGWGQSVELVQVLRRGGRSALTTVQHQVLSEAIARAQSAPRLRPRRLTGPAAGDPAPAHQPVAAAPVVPARPTAGHLPAPLDLSVRVELLAREDWPDVLWHRTPHKRYSTRIFRPAQQRLPYASHKGILAQAQAPRDAELVGALPGSIWGRPARGGQWVEIDVRRLRTSLGSADDRGMQITRITDAEGTRYVIGSKRRVFSLGEGYFRLYY